MSTSYNSICASGYLEYMFIYFILYLLIYLIICLFNVSFTQKYLRSWVCGTCCVMLFIHICVIIGYLLMCNITYLLRLFQSTGKHIGSWILTGVGLIIEILLHRQRSTTNVYACVVWPGPILLPVKLNTCMLMSLKLTVKRKTRSFCKFSKLLMNYAKSHGYFPLTHIKHRLVRPRQ